MAAGSPVVSVTLTNSTVSGNSGGGSAAMAAGSAAPS